VDIKLNKKLVAAGKRAAADFLIKVAIVVLLLILTKLGISIPDDVIGVLWNETI